MNKSVLVIVRKFFPPFFLLTTLKRKNMKKVLVIVEMACVYALILAAIVGVLGMLGCGITDLFIEVPREYYAFFGLLVLIPLLMGYAYEGIIYLIRKKK